MALYTTFFWLHLPLRGQFSLFDAWQLHAFPSSLFLSLLRILLLCDWMIFLMLAVQLYDNFRVFFKVFGTVYGAQGMFPY